MIIKTEIFKIKHNDLAPAAGRMLIAEPFLKEQYFQRSVVFIIECHDEGGMGIVLNKVSNVTLNDIIENLDNIDDIPVYIGGPVSKDRLFYLHTLGDIIPGATEIADGIYIDGDFDVILNYIRSGNPVNGYIRFFVGYSGWDVGQLVEEIENNSWLVAENDKKIILSLNGDFAWRSSVLYMDSIYHAWLNYPKDPLYN